jgi:type VI secretion system protein ImpF
MRGGIAVPIETYETGVAFSLLDRLINSEQEIHSSSWEQMRAFKASVCRDLTALLNTRRAEQDFDPVYTEAANSLLSFGITDFTSYNLKSGLEQEQVRRSMERAIRQFEPRLTQVEVSVAEPDPLRPVLQFQISALLRIEPADEPVVFDATLQRESRRIAVSGGGS